MNNEKPKHEIKQLLSESKIGYAELSDKLKQIGINEDNIVLANKVNRGTFSFSFVLQICEALGKKIVFVDLPLVAKITKNQFIQIYIDLAHNFQETESDEIYALLEDTMKMLFTKAGFAEEVYQTYQNSAFASSIFNEYIDEKMVSDMYDELQKDNLVVQKTLNIANQIKLL